ncbi:MAG TPA: gamma-glutamyltransferase family protein [Candidatus Acidoferrales bacterium]|nr:gamma-glutamyltransferase family protein [Candidatus Acidoferrales bacterium]
MRTGRNLARHLPSLGLLAALALAAGSAGAAGPAQGGQQPSIEYSQYAKAARAAQANWPGQAVRAAHGMVVSDDPLASAAGEEILKAGGNAVDAGVAVAFALAVVYPEAGNLGGGGFMLVRQASGKAALIDYREEAPKRATAKMYLNPDGSLIPNGATTGYRAVGVPGTVAGMELALRNYGSMKLARVMAPAIRLAEQGFPVSDRLAKDLAAGRKRMQAFAVSERIFLHNGELYKPGEIFKQPELAATLRRIARHGSAGFYRGETARMLAADMAKNGGLIGLEDLAAYRAKIRAPLEAGYPYDGHTWEVITSPPPSSGGVAIIEALNILQALPLKPVPGQAASAWSNAENVHYVAEAMRRVFADRAAYLADPDFNHVPVRGLISPAYASGLRASIDATRATPSADVHAGNPAPYDRAARRLSTRRGGLAALSLPKGHEGTPAGAARVARLDARSAAAWSEWTASRPGHTTHFSVVDAAGNAVSNTYTINDFFGSGVTTTAGFLLNDEMDDFTTAPGKPNVLFHLYQSAGNEIAPGKRPLSSMVPTMVLRDGKLSLVTGSPGGPRIISATLLSVLNWMRMGMDAQQAINAPRFHHQWMPDVLFVEPTLSSDTIRQLEQRGYHVDARGWIGQVNAIGIDPRTGDRLGAGDPRRGGAAAGN